jgi:DNA-binding XRE family transcriptional regulator
MRLRTLRRVTQQELAEALGVTRHTVTNWETGRSVPTLTIAQTRKLCEVLGVTFDQLPDNFGPQPIHDTSPFFNRRATDNPN